MTPEPTRDADVDLIVRQAAHASDEWRAASLEARAAALVAMGDALDAHADRLIPIAREETRLAEARLQGELKRTSFQLRLFADIVRDGAWIDARIDHADADWPMGAPRPDLRRQLESVGAVLVFSASNFPFAFSVAGGDTASALAAGSAVVLKAHGGHPRLSQATAEVVMDAARAAGAPAHLLQVVYGRDAGIRALRAPEIKAASFTGSVSGGRALFDIAASRDEPIPFYGELGSVNPVFVTARPAEERAERVAAEFVASFTGSAGQLCTKPGLLFVPEGSALERALGEVRLEEGAPLLNESIATGFERTLSATQEQAGVRVLAEGAPGEGHASILLTAPADAVLEHFEALTAEMFGPAAVVVPYRSDDQLGEIAERLEGQLTATLIAEDDEPLAADLLAALTRRAGRVLWNQWPTGVSVTFAQQHGGPYPATTAVGTTSVGTAAIERFLRPVAYQNVPDALLPAALREENPLGIPRLVDGRLQSPPAGGEATS